MSESRIVHDPFLNRDVEVSDRLKDRLRGRYAVGPTMENGEPEFGWRTVPVPPIQEEAANELERLESALEQIHKIVYTPTSKTKHRTAQDHYQADFDAIRKICEEFKSC